MSEGPQDLTADERFFVAMWEILRADGSPPVPEQVDPVNARRRMKDVSPARARRGLWKLDLCPDAASGLRKLVPGAGAYAFFHFFSTLDAVADPPDWPGDEWLGAALAEPTEDDDRDMVHDQFYETWWEYAPGGRDA